MSRGERSTAFALVAACCRPPGDPSRDDRVRRLADRVDWTEVIAFAARHRIEGLLVEALGRAGVVSPREAIDSLRARAVSAARLALRQAVEAVRLQSALDRAGIDNLVIKGVVLDMLAWRRIGLKQAWDIDLLVGTADARLAAGILAGEGYVLTTPGKLDDHESWDLWLAHAKECGLVHPQTGLVVELHWRLADPALLPTLGPGSPYRWVALTQTLAVRTLAAEETFAYLCVHGACHAWSRLKWLADLAAIIAPLEPRQKLALHRRAIALGGGRCSAVALALCERLLGVGLPDELSRAVRGDPRTLALVTLALDTISSLREVIERPLAEDRILLSQLLFADGAGFVRGELRRQWTSLDDRRRLRLPRRLHVLYHIARIPLWAWRRLTRPGQRAGASPMLRGEP
jgi:hypothetical protein